MGFTKDELDIFVRTSQTANLPNRLQKRCRAIFELRADFYKDKRVLDIGSHDGRWSYMALKMGAAHVTGIEARPHLVELANQNLSKLNIPEDKYQFIEADALSYMETATETYDIVLCLGFFYHVFDHIDLVRKMARFQPQTMIIDTNITASEAMGCTFKKENVAREGHSIEKQFKTFNGYNYVAWPSIPYLRSILGDFGYGFLAVDWKKILGDNTRGLGGYLMRNRITAYCDKIIEKTS